MRIIYYAFLILIMQSCKVASTFNVRPTKILIGTSEELIENNINVVKNIFKSIQTRTNNDFEAAEPYMENTLDSILFMFKQYEEDESENQKTIKNYSQVFNVLTDFNNTLNLFVTDTIDTKAKKASADILGSFNAHLQDLKVTNIAGLKLSNNIFNATSNLVSTLTQNKVAKLRKKKMLSFLQESQTDFNSICNYLATQNKEVLLQLIKKQQTEEVGEIVKTFTKKRSSPSYENSDGKPIVKNYLTTKNKWLTDSLITEETAKGYYTLKEYYANLIMALKVKHTPDELVLNVKQLYTHINTIRNALKEAKNEN